MLTVSSNPFAFPSFGRLVPTLRPAPSNVAPAAAVESTIPAPESSPGAEVSPAPSGGSFQMSVAIELSIRVQFALSVTTTQPGGGGIEETGEPTTAAPNTNDEAEEAAETEDSRAVRGGERHHPRGRLVSLARKLVKVADHALREELKDLERALDKMDDPAAEALRDQIKALRKDLHHGLRDAFKAGFAGGRTDVDALLAGVREALSALADGLSGLIPPSDAKDGGESDPGDTPVPAAKPSIDPTLSPLTASYQGTHSVTTTSVFAAAIHA